MKNKKYKKLRKNNYFKEMKKEYKNNLYFSYSDYNIEFMNTNSILHFCIIDRDFVNNKIYGVFGDDTLTEHIFFWFHQNEETQKRFWESGKIPKNIKKIIKKERQS